MLARIVEIKKIIPYKIEVKFNTGELREIDFESWLHLSEMKTESVYHKLKDENIFRQVKLDSSGTIAWNNLLQYQDLDGKMKDGPIDFCPDVLYEISKPIAD